MGRTLKRVPLNLPHPDITFFAKMQVKEGDIVLTAEGNQCIIPTHTTGVK